MLGKIRLLKSDKGYGFIQPAGCMDHRDGHFFHCSKLVGVQFHELNEGDAVEFDSVPGAKGVEAHNVRRGRN